MPLWEFSFALGQRPAEEVARCCFELGAMSVTWVDAQDDPVLEPAPGEMLLWPDTRVRALFADLPEPDVIACALVNSLTLSPQVVHTQRVQERVWEREWLQHFHPLRFGRRLWICPRHESVGEPGAVVVRLDPGLAFGTGTHPSTALCLDWLEEHLLADQSVIDYGCGSGILAIAAVKLGAAIAHCFDIDPQALVAATANAAVNEVAAQVHVCATRAALAPGADVLLANILSAPLCALAPDFAALVRSGGQAVLAGVMEHEIADVTEAYATWFDMNVFEMRDGWVGLAGRRGDAAPSPGPVPPHTD